MQPNLAVQKNNQRRLPGITEPLRGVWPSDCFGDQKCITLRGVENRKGEEGDAQEDAEGEEKEGQGAKGKGQGFVGFTKLWSLASDLQAPESEDSSNE